jgi:hypothetical protein
MHPKSSSILACVLAFSACAAASAVQAQVTSADSASSPNDATLTSLNNALARFQQAATNKDIFTFDYGIPTSPALTLIGASTDKSSPSTSLKPFVFSLPAEWGGPSDSQAFSTDLSVMWLMQELGSASKETYAEYVGSGYWNQLAYRTRLEGALMLGTDGGGDPTKAKPSRIAFGFSSSLLSSSDPGSTLAADGRPVWGGCVHDFLYSDATYKQYEAQYDADPATVDENKFIHETTVMLTAWDAQHTVPAPLTAEQLQAKIERGYSDLAVCMQAGEPCAKYDTGGLRSAIAAKDFEGVHSQLISLEATIKAAADKSSVTLVNNLGIPAKLDACMTKANAVARNSPDLDIGAGIVWSGMPGQVEDFQDPSGAIWIAGHIPIGLFNSNVDTIADADAPSLMLGGSLRAAWSEMVATGDTTTPSIKANTLNAWVGLERYTSSTRFAAQAGYNDVRAVGSGLSSFSKSGFRWQLSASIKAGNLVSGILNGDILSVTGSTGAPQNGIWVNATYGSASGTTTTLDDKVFLVSFSYSPSSCYNLFGECPSSTASGP